MARNILLTTLGNTFDYSRDSFNELFHRFNSDLDAYEELLDRMRRSGRILNPTARDLF